MNNIIPDLNGQRIGVLVYEPGIHLPGNRIVEKIKKINK